MSAIAFLPWISLNESLVVGDLRLLPYERRKLPGDLPFVQQRDVDAVFGAYSNGRRSIVKHGALLEIGDWKSGQEPSPQALADIRHVCALITVSALSKRQLFGGHAGYVNSAAYKVIIQRFEAGQADRFAYETRRRDGGTLNYWTSDSFNYARPTHTEASWRIELDTPLLECLLKLPRTHRGIFEAVAEFNAANSDSPDMPIHVEVVMLKTAFEWLLQIKSGNEQFTTALSKLVPVAVSVENGGKLPGEWSKKAPPKDGRLLTAWGLEFCALRGASAHGQKGQPKVSWDAHSHLAFGAVLFPLVLKKRLADEGFYKLSELDEENLQSVERLLAFDPFQKAEKIQRTGRRTSQVKHPWSVIASEARAKVASQRFRRDLVALIEASTSSVA